MKEKSPNTTITENQMNDIQDLMSVYKPLKKAITNIQGVDGDTIIRHNDETLVKKLETLKQMYAEITGYIKDILLLDKRFKAMILLLMYNDEGYVIPTGKTLKEAAHDYKTLDDSILNDIAENITSDAKTSEDYAHNIEVIKNFLEKINMFQDPTKPC